MGYEIYELISDNVEFKQPSEIAKNINCSKKLKTFLNESNIYLNLEGMIIFGNLNLIGEMVVLRELQFEDKVSWLEENSWVDELKENDLILECQDCDYLALNEQDLNETHLKECHNCSEPTCPEFMDECPNCEEKVCSDCRCHCKD